MNVFIIHSMGMSDAAIKYASHLETAGHQTYVPARDTDQTDVSTILHSNRAGMEWADEVRMLWDISSLGSIFDLGMAYMARKPTMIVRVKRHHWVKEILGHVGRYIFVEGEYHE